jgi:DNA-binding IclR family transcriptional regulator
MLTVLERRKYIIKDPLSGNYSLSLKLYELAHTHSPVEQIVKAASRPMRVLSDEVRESCHLSILSRDKLVVLLQMESPEKVQLSIEVGARFSPINSTSGRLLLAHLAEEELRSFLESDSEYQALARKEREQLLRELDHLRLATYSISDSESRPGMKDIAALVGNPQIGVTAALTIPCLPGGRSEQDLKRIRNALLACANEITNTLGLRNTAWKREQAV